jgi:uncharacterized membrane protein
MKKAGLFTVCMWLATSVASAQDLPAAFVVKGVADDDVLNIRAEPNANAAVLDGISPYATSVEVLELSADGAWGLVSTGEGNGWAAMRFLEPMPAQDANLIPRPMTCMGTEPFWSVGLMPRGDEYSEPDYRVDLELLSQAVAPGGYLAVLKDAPELADEVPAGTHTLIISREQCSDGMSDRRYGWAVKLFTENGEGNMLRHGCCTLDLR